MKSLRIFIFFAIVVLSSQDDISTVELVHVFFRHGARTPELKDVYPNDPHKLENFLPMGWGQLTNFGKQQAFKLGTVLRKRYDSFLGDILYPGMVFAQSTDFDRTKMSALLVLAGLFPPSPSQTWNEQVPWLPIPLAYEKNERDYFLKRPNEYCPVYMKELELALQSDEVATLMKERQETFDYLTNHTGKPISTLSNVMGLYQTLTAEMNMNLSLPEWTKNVYPEIITELAIKQCELENSKPILKRLNGGRSLQEVVENIIAKTTDSLEPPERKIFLYSGHENNVINILAALDLFTPPHFPKYSAAVIFELHSLGEQKYAVKIVHLKDINQEVEEKQLNDCDVLCPLDKFLEITKTNIPVNFTAECNSQIYLD